MRTDVKAKKYLGQHFLKDENIAQSIVQALQNKDRVLEIGAGMGVLTKYLITTCENFKVVEIDKESIDYLTKNFVSLKHQLIEGDFLKLDLKTLFDNKTFSIIGNFPYNISNLILFKVFDNKDLVCELTGMFQKEVALRICAQPGSKTYGILSVLLSTFYDIEYLFSVPHQVFIPQPKVESAVIRLTRNQRDDLGIELKDFVRVVKTSFNQRRKMLRQSLKPLQKDLSKVDERFLTLRPEQLSKEDFIKLTQMIYSNDNIDR